MKVWLPHLKNPQSIIIIIIIIIAIIIYFNIYQVDL